MPGFIQDYVTESGIHLPIAALAPDIFMAKAGDGFMQVTFDRYADASKIGVASPINSFTTTIPLGEEAQALLDKLLKIIANSLGDTPPPTNLEGVTFVP